MEVDVKEEAEDVDLKLEPVEVLSTSSSGQNEQMEADLNHLFDEAMQLNTEKMIGMVEYLVVEGNPSDGTPELKLETVNVVDTTDIKKSKYLNAKTIKLLKDNHVCTSKCFPTRKYPQFKKNVKTGKKEMLVCVQCALECPKGNGKKALLDLDSLSTKCRRKVIKTLTKELKCDSTDKSSNEKPITLEASQELNQEAVYDEIASERYRMQEEEKLWNDFFEKQDKGQGRDFLEVMSAALGKQLSWGSRVPCRFCTKVLPLWLHRCHVRFFHDPSKMNVCTRCTRRYSTAFLLHRHLRPAHSRYVRYCVECRLPYFLKEMFVLKRRYNDKKQEETMGHVTTSDRLGEKSEENNNTVNKTIQVQDCVCENSL